jgi:hypothetical protein
MTDQSDGVRPLRVGARPTLFDAVSACLPFFDDLPASVVARLAAGGYGRGLLTASLRARLRKAGFADMGALASPADLMAVRKVGPVRVDAIRVHLLGEIARLVPGARAVHDRNATDRRRMERLRAVPLERLALDAALVGRLGPAGTTCADLASRRRPEIGPDRASSAADLDRIVAALVRVLLPESPRVPPADPEAAEEALAAHDRAALLRDRDREWDEAAPAPPIRPGRTP